eukprot:scaffold22602_cov154-Cylindrotheca_fusiformis.AAC.7
MSRWPNMARGRMDSRFVSDNNKKCKRARYPKKVPRLVLDTEEEKNLPGTSTSNSEQRTLSSLLLLCVSCVKESAKTSVNSSDPSLHPSIHSFISFILHAHQTMMQVTSTTTTLTTISLLVAVCSATTTSRTRTTTSSSLSSVVASKPKPNRREALKGLLSQARRLDDGDNNNNNNDAVYEFLDNYSLRLTECHPDISFMGNREYPIYGVVVFRMCPSNSCVGASSNSKTKMPCTEGYADFAVDIGTFVYSMLTDQEDNFQWDDEVGEWADYAECTEYDQEDGDQSYYVGPTCTEDKKNIRLALFDEYTCQTESSTSFSSISNGWTLPYSDGGLVSTQCTSCYDNDNDGGAKELCMDLYDAAEYRCEKDWDVKHYYWNSITEVMKYGQDTTGCGPIDRFNYTRKKANVLADLFFVLVLVALALGGWFFYQSWWDKQKENLERIDTDDEGDDEEADDEYHAHESDEDDDHGFGGGGGGMPSGTLA